MREEQLQRLQHLQGRLQTGNQRRPHGPGNPFPASVWGGHLLDKRVGQGKRLRRALGQGAHDDRIGNEGFLATHQGVLSQRGDSCPAQEPSSNPLLTYTSNDPRYGDRIRQIASQRATHAIPTTEHLPTYHPCSIVTVRDRFPRWGGEGRQDPTFYCKPLVSPLAAWLKNKRDEMMRPSRRRMYALPADPVLSHSHPALVVLFVLIIIIRNSATARS